MIADKPVVLWLSRHLPLPAQIRVLDDVLKDYELVIYDTRKNPVPTAQHAAELVVKHRADIVVPVLPLSFIMHLLEVSKKMGFIVVRAKMRVLHQCDSQPCVDFDPDTDTIVETKDRATGQKFYRHFRFIEFRIVDDIVIKDRPFTKCR